MIIIILILKIKIYHFAIIRENVKVLFLLIINNVIVRELIILVNKSYYFIFILYFFLLKDNIAKFLIKW
jgi:hypothetical protein